MRTSGIKVLFDCQRTKFSGLRAGGNSVSLGFAAGSDDEAASFKIDGGLTTMMFDFIFPVFSQKVETDGILFRVDFLEKALSELNKVCGFNPAFKNGKLDALTVIKTGLGDATQAARAVCGGSRDVVCDEYVHELYEKRNAG